MARQLERQNEKISFLAMFDSAPPDETRKQQALRFNKQSEQEIIRRFLPDPALIEQLNQQEDVAEEYEISRTWHLVMDYMEANNLNLEALQTTIPTDWLTAIQGSRGSGIREQLNSINTVRTLDNARNQYVPEDILNTGIHFFKARGQHPPADTEKWNTYTAKPLQIYEIDGDHYSTR
jgi:thioesterase domain-containing protein